MLCYIIKQLKSSVSNQTFHRPLGGQLDAPGRTLFLCEQTVFREGGIRIHTTHTKLYSHKSHKFESCFWQILWNFTSKSHYSQDPHKAIYTILQSIPPFPISQSHKNHTKMGILTGGYHCIPRVVRQSQRWCEC
jgi:hypothetical protein